PPPFRQRARDDAAGDRLDDNRTRVGDDRDADRDERDRHDPRAVARGHRVQPCESHRDDAAVEGMGPRFVEGFWDEEGADAELQSDREQESRDVAEADVFYHGPSMWPWKTTSSTYPGQIQTSAGSTSICLRNWRAARTRTTQTSAYRRTSS